MNKKRRKILRIVPATYVVIVGLNLLYQVAHRGYPAKSIGDCFALAFKGGLKFFTTTPGILILIGFIVWFCSSTTPDSKR